MEEHSNGKRLALAATTAALGVASVAGCSSSNGSGHASPSVSSATPTSSVPTVSKVGGSAEFFSQLTGEQGTTLRVRVNSAKYTTSVPNPGGAPFRPTRGIYITMSLTVANTGHAPGLFNPPNFVWVSPAGQVVKDPGTILGGATPDQGQDMATLQPGQHVTGTEYFDVPSKGGHLDYEIFDGQPPLLIIDLPGG